jgi:uncharacterized repeat protein (TIGR02543 family)
VSVTLLGSGIVTSSPEGMFCSSGTCVQDFVAGSAVKLLANGAPGWTFTGWSGSCTGTEICKLTVGSGVTVYATFTASGFPAPPPPGESGTPCSSPDPFAAMGGGTCQYGIWIPPGMTISGPGPEPDCSTPDPFAAMGGGTCHDGGWLPPGMTMPSGDSPGRTPGSFTGAPCTTQDPFVGMGGGVCYYGGWLPQGMPLPTADTPSESFSPSPGSSGSPLPGATSGASIGSLCTMPDPFTTIGGGTCYNGGWLPPGMSPPTGGSTGSSTCTTPDPFISIPDLIGVCANGGWVPTIRR